MKRLVLVGASGSIGLQTIDVIRQHPDEFTLVAFGVGSRVETAREILKEFPCKLVGVGKAEDIPSLQSDFPDTTFVSGMDGLKALAECEGYDVFVNALVGFVGLEPTLCAIQKGHDIALANKETLVVGGELIARAKEAYHVNVVPIDSEHSAIFQCLQGARRSDVKRLIITASGGSFRNKSRDELGAVTKEEALAHPNWAMGEKITIDSATMMNKGFEVIEAHYLFDMPYENIDVLMHEESIIHSLVEYQDHAVLAQLGIPDMRIPIQYALTYPNRYHLEVGEPLDLGKVGLLHFKEPDFERYPLLALAFEAGKAQGILPAVMNAANEVANAAFRRGEIPFLAIEDIVIGATHTVINHPVTSLQDVQEADAWGREYALNYIERNKQ